MNFLLEKVTAREILDSRGNPTVEVDAFTSDGQMARASVPSGASTGSREATERRDGDTGRFSGKGVRDAIKAVETEIYDAVRGTDVREQRRLDNLMRELDGTETKSRLGANAILGVSLAVARLASQVTRQPLYRYLGGLNASLLPVPCMNIINGGVHARGQGADFQEFMIAPHGASSLTEAIRQGSEVYQALRQILLSRNLSAAVGDEGDLPRPYLRTGILWNSLFRPLRKPATVQGRYQHLYGPRIQRILPRWEISPTYRKQRPELRRDDGLLW